MNVQRAKIVRRVLDGVLLLDKPLDISSNNALQKARWLLQAKKGGHTGVLDPLATGLLPLCFGEATKFAQRYLDSDKGYLATMTLGKTTTTGDREGDVLQTRPVAVTKHQFIEAAKSFLGAIEQIPPMYSALKVDGKPMYAYARAGLTVARAARTVCIYALELRAFRGTEVDIYVKCSKGTYIRVLAEDLGERLGCGAHLGALRRTETGGFVLDHAVTLAALEAMNLAEREQCLLPVDHLLLDLPAQELSAELADKFAHGQAVRHDGTVGELRVYGPGGFLGLGEIRHDTLHPVRLMSSGQ